MGWWEFEGRNADSDGQAHEASVGKEDAFGSFGPADHSSVAGSWGWEEEQGMKR